MCVIVKYTKLRNLIATGLVGLVAISSMNISTAQDIPAPKDVAAAPADAEKTKSGLASKVLKKGTGTVKPAAADTVTVHYTGWTTDGKMFDSSITRGEPTSFPLNGVIAGWTEGLQLMVEGEKRRFWIPEALAYKGQPGRPAGMLVFDVELLKVKKAPKAPEVPKDVAKAPEDAEVTKSGLASKVLKKGNGGQKPNKDSIVTVHYSGWTTDGKMFDSSIMRGEPTSFPLGGVIAGWTEGLQLMEIGEKRRFWIPEALAYKGQAGAPAGMLVFDVELLDAVTTPADVANPPADAKKTESGLVSKELKAGEGELMTKDHIITFHFSGWTADGTRIDSTIGNPRSGGQPQQLRVGDSFPGWVEGLQQMKKGEKRRFWIPNELVVGENPAEGAPKGTICFDVEILDAKLGKKIPDAPENVAKAPEDAVVLMLDEKVEAPKADDKDGEKAPEVKKVDLGVKTKVLAEGTGEKKPADSASVKIHFTGWFSDGKLFNTTLNNPEPVLLPLAESSEWLKAVVKEMVVGEKRRVWAPNKLVVGENAPPHAPKEDFCFDFELIEIVE